MMVLDHVAPRRIVLVVEDEMLLRMRAVDIVEGAGYTSVEAVDADDAIAIDGLELARSVRKRWPPIKIILVSGQLRLSPVEIPCRSRFFEKPLKAEDVIAEMHKMIGHG
jgi:CheY-like chemotaxis protein